ncbi:hypothetical protein [Longimicrobium terrae]|uniref:Uncharacterized protein n=1 Tax=Longimicrobium terrae TaxID=1639882 RepID=A0A841H0E2_9BACT|nr:hypothetical protein [Longimicrobium terrae]MBB4636919.1 hypothetical protein [Longimicrobium terrae]MBB6071473.1 hypothetical protein [Longimicrobium terrae]NNC31310.1 hypothetical protein [Longimicrobium terrae]
MRKILCCFVVLAACVAGAPVHAQNAPERTDTIRGEDFSDRPIASAFGLPQPTEDQINLMRSGARCMQTDDAVLCNLKVEGRAWEECANTALVGQFVVWFDMLGGRASDKRVYVAVDCDHETVTVTSLRKFPEVEFTLARRQRNETEERTRSVIFIQSGQR